MILERKKPVGIDVPITRIQNSIWPDLSISWGNVDVYGRAYLKRTKKNTSVEAYYKDGEYRPLMHSEGNKIFFLQSEESTSLGGNRFRCDVWAVAILNLDKAKSGFEQRADEAAKEDLLSSLRRAVGGKRITSILTGTENLKRVSKDLFKYGSFNLTDIHPYHTFMVRMSIDYNYKC